MKKRNILPCTLALAVIAAVGATGANAAKTPKLPIRPANLAAQLGDQPSFHRIVVQYRDGAREATDRSAAAAGITRALSRSGLAGTRAASASHLRKLATGEHLIRLSRSLDRVETEALLRQIQADPNVVSVRPDRMRRITRAAKAGPDVKPAYVPNDPYFVEYQWHFLAPDGSPTYDGGPNRGGANVSAAWDLADGNGITIAVLDTGITEHPDLDTSLGDAGYDFISDSFVSGRPTDDRVPGGWDLGDWTIGYPGAGSCIQDYSSWHGTHVAATAGAELTGNGVGMTGIAHNAKVLPVRVLGHCGGYESDIIDAIVWAAGGTVPGVPDNPNPAHVINLSLGGEGPCSAGEAAAIAQANALGAVVVVAAGNENTNVSNASPANCPGVIAVASNGVTSRRAFYSNYGAGITLSAPGGGIFANDGAGGAQIYDGFVWQALNPGDTTPVPLAQINPANAYGGMAGTSQAAPHVAGVVALMQGARLDAGLPLLTPEEVKDILVSTVSPFTVAPGASQPIGPGILNAAAAVAKAIEPPCEENCGPVATPISNGVAVTGLAGAAGSEVLYSIEVPAGVNGPLSITTSGGSGDVTLLVSRGEEPTDANAQYRSERPGNNETVRVDAPQAGTYYIKLVGVRAYSNVRLVARHN
ncbi:serine protease [Luteimonas sp. J16]|jgi:serine protease|uniref:S8 family serine peptidase n=1 Tax=unclassified Luteimonas TaxID=2629088 RepID=UPI00047B476B|nr:MULTISPECIES: S8 family serine peptidase [unclassified Luteimonas]TWG89467.1 serine protease [Luteimonas sp. J16]